jgi:D-glycero-alpha-D-manno-heptose-7-phosphate kinase
MIISKTPLRMSFVGGGSDLPAFFEDNGPGKVISSSINYYVYVILKKRFESGFRCSYSSTENVSSISEIQHPYIRNALADYGVTDSLEIISAADIPGSGSGLGSSSSFSVGLYKSLDAFFGDSKSNAYYAEKACNLEINLCGNNIGKQDQYAASFGGLREYTFYEDGSVTNSKITVSRDMEYFLNNNIVSIYVGGTRSASEILEKKSAELKRDKNKVRVLREMVSLVGDFVGALKNDNFSEIGRLLNYNWELKSSLSNDISNDFINSIYDTALKAGASGGKLLGAGGGGFMVFVVDDIGMRKRLVDALSKYQLVDFKITGSGSKIIYGDG